MGYKWVFIVKHKEYELIMRFKRRLVVKGFAQTYGVAYSKAFSLIEKMNTNRVLLSFTASLDWSPYQFDLKICLLYCSLDEEVYMGVSHGLESSTTTKRICRLMKSFYRLKWFPKV